MTLIKYPSTKLEDQADLVSAKEQLQWGTGTMEKGNIGQLFIKMVQQAGAEQIKPKTICTNKEKRTIADNKRPVAQ